MSKRVANTKERTARFGRIRIGWRKHRMLRQFENLQDIDKSEITEEGKAAFAEFSKTIRSMIPKKFLRRSQNR